jgi:hypothetical protein
MLGWSWRKKIAGPCVFLAIVPSQEMFIFIDGIPSVEWKREISSLESHPVC